MARKKAAKKKAAPKKKKPAEDPMRIWKEVCTTPEGHAELDKKTGRLTLVAIHRKIKRATELWGPQGGKWKVLCHHTVTPLNYPNSQGKVVRPIECRAEVTLIYPRGKIENIVDAVLLVNEAGHYDGGAYKESRTRALAKAFAQLGFNDDCRTGDYVGQIALDEQRRARLDERIEQARAEERAESDRDHEQGRNQFELGRAADELERSGTFGPEAQARAEKEGRGAGLDTGEKVF